ncbi:MAG: GTPase Era [Saprospirales bacterium]|nr:GTPase Era [Saprospirales bacterium]MBK8921039.1 GTPase Era [Saprospirales bacterium]
MPIQTNTEALAGEPVPFRSGFVNIVGRPNAGKSTLMNALVGERMSIITHKPQTTRHRIIGILSHEHFQVIFSDTPGYVRDPAYKMHQAMNRFVEGTLEDADLLLLVFDLTEELEETNPVFTMLAAAEAPVLLVLNKMDLVKEQRIQDVYHWWAKRIRIADFIAISALSGENTAELLQKILTYIPQGPVYYPPDQLTDRPERFFVSEIIREKIFLLYAEEIPYSCEVGIESYQETVTKTGEPLVRIQATIYVLRETQKGIILGKGGAAIKKLGMVARMAIETFLQSKVFLETSVKVRNNWRDDERMLQQFGYK